MIASLFFFHMTYWSFKLGQGWLLRNHFCKPCQSSSKFWHCAQWGADAWNVALLWKLPQVSSCSRCALKQRQLGQKQFWHVFTKLIAVQSSMTKYEWTMNQLKVEWLRYHALKSVLLYLFSIWENWSQTRVFFYAHCILSVKEIWHSVTH